MKIFRAFLWDSNNWKTPRDVSEVFTDRDDAETWAWSRRKAACRNNPDRLSIWATVQEGTVEWQVDEFGDPLMQDVA